MQRNTILVLKILIVLLLALLLFCQIAVVPAVAAQSAVRYGDVAYLQIPGIVVGVAFLVCVQVVLIATVSAGLVMRARAATP